MNVTFCILTYLILSPLCKGIEDKIDWVSSGFRIELEITSFGIGISGYYATG